MEESSGPHPHLLLEVYLLPVTMNLPLVIRIIFNFITTRLVSREDYCYTIPHSD